MCSPGRGPGRVALTLEDGGTPPRPTCMCDRRATCCVLVHLHERPPALRLLAGRLAAGVRTGYLRPLFMQRDRRGVTPRRRELKRDGRGPELGLRLVNPPTAVGSEGGADPSEGGTPSWSMSDRRQESLSNWPWLAGIMQPGVASPPCKVMAQPPRSLRWARSAHGQWPCPNPAALGCFLWRLFWATPLQRSGDETSCFAHQSHDVESSRRSLRRCLFFLSQQATWSPAGASPGASFLLHAAHFERCRI